MKTKDEQIKKSVVDMLYLDNRVDASDIHVDVTDGVVTLRGTVPSFTVKEASLFDAWKVPGVKKVNNDSFVRFPTTAKALTDSQIEDSIKKQEEEIELHNKTYHDILGKISSLDTKISESEKLKEQISTLELCPTCFQNVNEDYKQNITVLQSHCFSS